MLFFCLCGVCAVRVCVCARPRSCASVGVNDVSAARRCSRAGRRANELPRGRKGGACGLRAKAAWPR